MWYQTDLAAPEVHVYWGEERTNYTCGDIGTEISGSALSSPEDVFTTVLGIIVGIVDIISTIAGLWDNQSVIGVLGSPYIFPAVVATVVMIIIGSFWFNRCLAKTFPEWLGGLDPTPNGCLAGIIDEIFETEVDTGIPWSTQHPSVSVVVKNIYWNRFSSDGASFIRCNNATTVSGDGENTWTGSMTVMAFFYNRRVCDVMAGSVTGGIIGGVVGSLGGALIGGAIGIACAALVFCPLAALIVGGFIAAGLTLLGAMGGGAIAQAAVGDETQEEADWNWRVGQFVKFQGPTVNLADLNGAKVFWHVNVDCSESFGDYPYNRPTTGYSHVVPDWELTNFDENGMNSSHVEGPCPDDCLEIQEG